MHDGALWSNIRRHPHRIDWLDKETAVKIPLRSGILLTALTALTIGACGQETAVLNTEKQQFSYAVGYRLAQDIKLQGLDVDAAALAQAIQDSLSGVEPRLSAGEMQAAVRSHLQQQMQEQEAQTKANQERGNAFLDSNKAKPGVVALPSGLQYKVLTEGTGRMPTTDDKVQVHYRGTLLDGTEFDSSYSRGEPTKLQVDQVIQGWQEALQLMPEGSKWEVFVPAELGYGTRGAGDAIGPGETLVFEIELISILQ